MASDEWLKNLKAGDDVIISEQGCFDYDVVSLAGTYTISVLGEGRKFSRETGRENTSCGAAHLIEPTPELIDIAIRSACIATLESKIDFDRMSTEDLQQIAALIETVKGGNDD